VGDEWWWDRPDIAGTLDFRRRHQEGPAPRVTARHWMGHVAIHSNRLAAEAAKIDRTKMAPRHGSMVLPPEIAIQPGKVYYLRARRPPSSSARCWSARCTRPARTRPTCTGHRRGVDGEAAAHASGCTMT